MPSQHTCMPVDQHTHRCILRFFMSGLIIYPGGAATAPVANGRSGGGRELAWVVAPSIDRWLGRVPLLREQHQPLLARHLPKLRVRVPRPEDGAGGQQRPCEAEASSTITDCIDGEMQLVCDTFCDTVDCGALGEDEDEEARPKRQNSVVCLPDLLAPKAAGPAGRPGRRFSIPGAGAPAPT